MCAPAFRHGVTATCKPCRVPSSLFLSRGLWGLLDHPGDPSLKSICPASFEMMQFLVILKCQILMKCGPTHLKLHCSRPTEYLPASPGWGLIRPTCLTLASASPDGSLGPILPTPPRACTWIVSQMADTGKLVQPSPIPGPKTPLRSLLKCHLLTPLPILSQFLFLHCADHYLTYSYFVMALLMCNLHTIKFTH